MPMDPRRRNESGEAVEQLQRGQDLQATAAGAGFARVRNKPAGRSLSRFDQQTSRKNSAGVRAYVLRNL